MLTRRIDARTLGPMLTETMATTGALFAPLLAATTFTLVLRLLGTDKLIEGWVDRAAGRRHLPTAADPRRHFRRAFVLDAFEIIFVAVPILIPPLLIRVPDAVWVSTLVLLTLQASFLLPPVGYALMMTRGVLGSECSPRARSPRALLPYLAVQSWCVPHDLLSQARASVGAGELAVARSTHAADAGRYRGSVAANAAAAHSAWASTPWRPDLSSAPERQIGRKALDMTGVEVGVYAELQRRPSPARRGAAKTPRGQGAA